MPATAGVIVVAPSGGDFTQLQPAIDAAVAGDTILVKPATYTSGTFVVDGKPLTIVGDGGLPQIETQFTIKNLAQGDTLTLAGLWALTTSLQTPALRIEDCQGAVRIVACRFNGAFGRTPDQIGWNSVEIEASPDVAFADSFLHGGYGFWDPSTCVGQPAIGGMGLACDSSNVALYDCDVRGGRGGTGAAQAGTGGVGISMTDVGGTTPFLFAARSWIQGGSGGLPLCNTSQPFGGDGGTGLMMGAPLSARLLNNGLFGGYPSTGGPIDREVTGAYGAPFVGGPPLQFVSDGLELSMPVVAREGALIKVTFNGLPGDHVYVNDGLDTTFAPVNSWRGVVIVPFPPASGVPVRTRRWGVISPYSEVLTVPYRVPVLPAGVEAQTRFLQGYVVRENGTTLGSFSTLTVVDSSL